MNELTGIRWFFESNDTGARLLRTIVQGILGVAVSALSYYAASAPEWVAVIVAPLVMAILSPIMGEISKTLGKEEVRPGGTD